MRLMRLMISPNGFLFWGGGGGAAYSFKIDIKIYSKCLQSVEQFNFAWLDVFIVLNIFLGQLSLVSKKF